MRDFGEILAENIYEREWIVEIRMSTTSAIYKLLGRKADKSRGGEYTG